MDDTIDVIVNVVDASSLERNLYLTLQLLELGKPVILALNKVVFPQFGFPTNATRIGFISISSSPHVFLMSSYAGLV